MENIKLQQCEPIILVMDETAMWSIIKTKLTIIKSHRDCVEDIHSYCGALARAATKND